MTQSAKDTAAYGMHLTPHTVRRVWAAATERPQATVRELAAELDIGYSTAATALRMLRAAGYIDFDPSCTGRRVLVPLIREFTIHPPKWKPRRST